MVTVMSLQQRSLAIVNNHPEYVALKVFRKLQHRHIKRAQQLTCTCSFCTELKKYVNLKCHIRRTRWRQESFVASLEEGLLTASLEEELLILQQLKNIEKMV